MEAQKLEVTPQAMPQATPEPRLLTQEERMDLRKRVLEGYKMTLEEARAVYETLRAGQGAAVITGESTKKTRKKKEAYSDAQLDADFTSLGI